MHVCDSPHLCDVSDDLLLRDEWILTGQIGDQDHGFLGVEGLDLLLWADGSVQIFAVSRLQTSPAGQRSGSDSWQLVEKNSYSIDLTHNYSGPVKSHCSQRISYCLTLCGPRDQNLLVEKEVIELDNLWSLYFFTIFLIVFHIYLLVKYFLFLISLSYLFVLAHPLG